MSPDWIYLTFAYLPLKPYGSINASRTLQGVAGIVAHRDFAAYKKNLDPKNQNPTGHHYPTMP